MQKVRRPKMISYLPNNNMKLLTNSCNIQVFWWLLTSYINIPYIEHPKIYIVGLSFVDLVKA